MAENQWQEVERALGEALELPEAERHAYLERAALGPAARRRVEQLLEAWDESGDFLESPALGTLPVGMPLGTRLGPWRLISILGAGGMATVYLAERDDEQFKQKAAIKVVAGARVSRVMERRFREERQILARLEHPNVARLIDGGVAPDGCPFLVMEFVAGSAIDGWCRQRNLGTRERLELFRQVCEAVHFAHQHLVVHCDIKPGNLLVTEDGTPKLLDFGIARMLAQGPQSTTTFFHPMTPEYASPEQIRGAPVGTATDIYSLGILLHELLTGRRPFVLSGKPLDEILQIIGGQDPPDPRCGSADLDAIVLKAIHKDPERRYTSAIELAADVSLFLEGRPLQARPRRAGYVLRKFFGRHRLAAGAVASAAVLLMTASAIIYRESRAAARHFEDVRRLAHFVIFDMHDAVAPLAGSTPARKLLVSNALQYLDSLNRDAGGDEALQRELALAYVRVGDVSGNPAQANLGDTGEALRSYRKAADLLDPLFRKHPRDQDLGQSLALVRERMESVYQLLRRFTEALRAADASLAIHGQLFREAPSDSNKRGLAIGYFTRAHAGAGSGRPALDQQPLRDYQAATEIFEELLSNRPGDEQRLRDAALGHKYIGGILKEGPQPDEALPHLRRAEELDQRRTEVHPEDRQAKLDLSFDYSQDAEFQNSRRKDLPAALALYRKTLAIREELSASDPSDIRVRDRVRSVEIEISRILLALNRPVEAAPHLQRSVQMSGALYSAEPSTRNRATLAWALELAGRKESAMRRDKSACEAFAQARDLYLKGRKNGDWEAWESKDLSNVTTRLAGCSK
jgi:eukaryotic-like serine/threonine-protein kinase